MSRGYVASNGIHFERTASGDVLISEPGAQFPFVAFQPREWDLIASLTGEEWNLLTNALVAPEVDIPPANFEKLPGVPNEVSDASEKPGTISEPRH